MSKRGFTAEKSYDYSFTKKIESISKNNQYPNLTFTNKAYHHLQEEMKKPLGLPNIGNTCFLNSILQFLYAAQQSMSFLIQTYGKQQNMLGAKFSKLIGKLFFYLQENSKNQGSIRNILRSMISKLQAINTQYKKNFQEDALQTLLNILLQIQEKHPNIVSAFDVEYRARCECSEHTTKERVLSYSENICASCKRSINRTLTNQPKYIIYSNAARRGVDPTRIQKGYFSKIDLKYRLVAQIVYYGSGKQGHYIARRFEQSRLYQISDSLVQQVQTKALRGKDALILLYQFQPRQNNQKVDFRSNSIMHKPERQDQILQSPKQIRQEGKNIKSTIDKKGFSIQRDNPFVFMIKPIVQLLSGLEEIKQTLIKEYKESNSHRLLNKIIGEIFYLLSIKAKEDKVNEALSAAAIQLQQMSAMNVKGSKNLILQSLFNILFYIQFKNQNAASAFDVQYLIKCQCGKEIVKGKYLCQKIINKQCRHPKTVELMNQPKYLIYEVSSHSEIGSQLNLKAKGAAVVYQLKGKIFEGKDSGPLSNKQYIFEDAIGVNTNLKKLQKSAVILLYQKRQALINNYVKQQLQVAKQQESLIHYQEGPRVKPMQKEELNHKNKPQKYSINEQKLKKPHYSIKADELDQTQMLRKCSFQLNILSGYRSKKNEPLTEKRYCLVELKQRSLQIQIIKIINLSSFPYYFEIKNKKFKSIFPKAATQSINRCLQQIGQSIQERINQCIIWKFGLTKSQDFQGLIKQNQIAKKKSSKQQTTLKHTVIQSSTLQMDHDKLFKCII